MLGTVYFCESHNRLNELYIDNFDLLNIFITIYVNIICGS